jgi:hypothetical protein
VPGSLSDRERELYRELGDLAADPRRHFGAEA